MKDIGSDIAYIIVMLIGGFLCISNGHPELAGLGLMIIAGFLKVPKTGRLNQPRRE
jgi:hypothetical protein